MILLFIISKSRLLEHHKIYTSLSCLCPEVGVPASSAKREGESEVERHGCKVEVGDLL